MSSKERLYALTDTQRNLMREAEGITQKASEKTGAFPQFGAKQSGSKSPTLLSDDSADKTVQRLAAKKALARQLNA